MDRSSATTTSSPPSATWRTYCQHAAGGPLSSVASTSATPTLTPKHSQAGKLRLLPLVYAHSSKPTADVVSLGVKKAQQQVQDEVDQWLERFEPCLSRTKLQHAILAHSDISASRADKLITTTIHQQRDSGGVPFWARGTLELAPRVLEACPVLHIHMHVLQDILQLYLHALKVDYFTGSFNPGELDSFTSKVKALVKNKIKSTKSSPQAGFLTEYQLRQIIAHHVAVFNTNDPLFTAQMYFTNWYQQEVYTPHSAYTEDHTPEEGTRRYRHDSTICTKLVVDHFLPLQALHAHTGHVGDPRWPGGASAGEGDGQTSVAACRPEHKEAKGAEDRISSLAHLC